ncbi:type I-C CRISPR-associated protein Cas8c/Csd1 [Paludisphaera mucosa]|uniref:Type I-C CRISPR-associated protein Cas8c/Csd1 n=1 Tax=Paludisphaera mucosa TaxID=3030827 RepID=A0ABT6F5G2_9BACT|nr:type I-C CRISPR-associated protein Cas8c/Csd1 [Paludisphaera mucosa]MDG3002828.1 type I-C CRISPR-associated protein Cas8c/Csd1 [Paludisphaera mucosa]
MILKELADLARREGLLEDPDYEPKPVRWTIDIGLGGKFLDAPETQGPMDAKGKTRPKVFQVPRTRPRTSGSAANFMVDKPEYVLGFDPDENPKKHGKLAGHRSLFREYVEEGLAFASEDPGMSALLCFLRDDVAVGQAIAKLRGPAVSNDLIAFRYIAGGENNLIHHRDAVRTAWKAMRNPSERTNKSLPACLVCGLAAAPVDVHPQIKRIPGGTTSGIALVSANSSAFDSLGLSITDGAPVCRPCSEAYGTALNRLFHPAYTTPKGETLSRRTFRLSDDTAVVYWASGADEHKFVDEFGDLDFVDPAKAGSLFEAVLKGEGALLRDATPFHALIISGGQGRAILRSYFQSTVGDVATRLREYFDDVEIVRRFENTSRWPALSWLVRSLAQQGKFENVDADLARRVFLAILDGNPFPPTVLAAAVRRIRAEREDPKRGKQKHSRERLALVRATLNRRYRNDDPRIKSLISKEVSVMLDPECNNNAYCLGRLLAVLEKLQGDAIGTSGASIVDRFYGAASATPAVVFATLLRKAQHHQAKLAGAFYPRLIQEILDLLPAEAFPSTLTLEEQGLFALGYYHEKADLWRSKPKPEVVAATTE